MNKLYKVFVYGTLKRGQPNHYWINESAQGYAKFLSEGRTVKELPLIIATRYNIPFLLYKENMGHRVSGEIYEVDDKVLCKLDELEDYPNLYDRDLIDIEMDIGETNSCLVYVLKVFSDELLKKRFLTEYKDSIECKYQDSSDCIELRDCIKNRP